VNLDIHHAPYEVKPRPGSIENAGFRPDVCAPVRVKDALARQPSSLLIQSTPESQMQLEEAKLQLRHLKSRKTLFNTPIAQLDFGT
jgi:hypothetical protein